MTLLQIASAIMQNQRFKHTEDQIVLFIDMVQKLAFAKDLIAFKNSSNSLTIYWQLNYTTAGTAPDANDVGQTVTGQTSGSTGTLISYDTTNKFIVIESDDDFDASEQVTAPTGLDVTLTATEHEEGYKGPYAWPTTPPVRKMIGLTTMTEAQMQGEEYTYTDERNDYGIYWNSINDRHIYKKDIPKIFDRTTTFVSAPNRTDAYRWVYFFKPYTITSLANHDSYLLIPEEHHDDLVQACIEHADITTEDGKTTKDNIEAHFAGFWDDLRKSYQPKGSASNQTSKGCGNVQSFLV